MHNFGRRGLANFDYIDLNGHFHDLQFNRGVNSDGWQEKYDDFKKSSAPYLPTTANLRASNLKICIAFLVFNHAGI